MPHCTSEYRLTIFLNNVITLEEVKEWNLLVRLNDDYRKKVLERLRSWAAGANEKRGTAIKILPERSGISTVVEISCPDDISPKSWKSIKKRAEAIITDVESKTRKKGADSGTHGEVVSLGSVSCI